MDGGENWFWKGELEVIVVYLRCCLMPVITGKYYKNFNRDTWVENRF